ncbi:MAG TPA: nuclear transport factor 2 family protein [Candidatus Eisenbacteria bacterium]
MIASLTLGAGLSPAAPARAAGSEALDSLLAAERAFSALSVQKGIKPAFIAYLAPDAIVFRPTATNGPKAIEGQLPSTNILTWEPSYAEISAAGDLGVTSGPWELLRADPTRPPIGYGHFISVWRKERGQWRVAVDIGTEHDKPERGVGSGDFTPGPKPVHGPKSSSVDLGVLDDTFTKAMMTRGIGAAYAAMGAADLRFHRDNIMPLVGLADVRALLEKTPGYYGYRTEGQRIASSHDLGCTWGQAAQHPPGGTVSPADSCVYLHVWRRGDDRQWKLALEVLNPLVRRR